MPQELILNMSDYREKAQALSAIRSLSGMQRITITRHRARRTDAQNRLYWPAYVQPFADWLRETGNDFTDEMAHEVLKKMFLETSIPTPTGECVSYVRSTTDLNVDEFSEYLEKVGAFLATECGVTQYGSNRNDRPRDRHI